MDRIKQIIINVSDSIPTAAIPEFIKESKHWWTNFDIPTFVSITVFILGFLITFFYEKYKKRKELELYKLLIIEWVKDSKKNIDQYINSLGEFAQKVKISDSLNQVPYHTNLLGIEKLNSLPIEKLTDSLLVNLKVDKNEKQAANQLFNLIRQLEFLEKNSNLVMSHYAKYCSENELLLKEWNCHFLELTKNIAVNNNDSSCTNEECEFYEYSLPLQKEIINLQKKNVAEGKNPEMGRSKCMNEYIYPVYEYGIQNSSELVDSTKIQKTIILLNEVKNLNIKYDNHAKFGIVFEEMNNRMIKARTILFDSIEYYEKHVIKSFWRIK